MTGNSFIRYLALILVLAMMIPIAAIGEGGDAWETEAESFVESIIENSDDDTDDEAEVVSESIESEPKEVEMDLQFSNEEEAPVSTPYFLTVNPEDKKAPTVTMAQGDTLQLRVSNASVLSWTAAKSGYVTISAIQTDDVGQYVDITADKPIKKLKLTAKLTGSKKSKATVTLVINDPYVPTGIVFSEAMPKWIAVGWKLNMDGMASFTPSWARGKLEWKAGGAGKIDKQGWLIPSKAGTAKISVKASTNKKATASCNIEVRANQVKMSDVPGAKDFSEIAGCWTLWPLSIAVNKKGGLDCQFYLLNGTPEKTKQIDKLELTLAVNGRDNIIARYTTSKKGKPFKASVAAGKSKVIKLTMDIVADLNNIYLPDCKLFFDINEDAMMTSGKKGTGPYPFQPTKFPIAASVTGITVSPAEATMTVGGEPLALTATLEPSDAYSPVVWSSSDVNVATVENGMVTAVGEGSAIITAACAVDESIKASCTVTVVPAPTVPVESITLNQNTATLRVGGESLALSWTVAPDNATNPALNWSSDRPEVATVADGIITPVSAGEAVITATAADGSGKTATCAVTVVDEPVVVPVESITLSQNTAQLTVGGEALTLTWTVAPDNATNPALNWSSDRPEVATVADGVITPVSAGEAVITATAADGSGKTATCAVTVVEPAPVSDFVAENGVITGYNGAGGAIVIPDADDAGNPIVAIGENAFKGKATITEVNVSSAVTEIRESAFEDCGVLESVTLPNGVTIIGKAAFKNCAKLRRMTAY